jgi:hypothetical protein
MNPLTIHHSLPHFDGVEAAIASDAQHRSYLAVAANSGHTNSLMFVPIDRVTLLELERGEVGLHAVMTERAGGEIFETEDFRREPENTNADDWS